MDVFNPSGLTPPDLHPVVKTHAQQVIDAINMAASPVSHAVNAPTANETTPANQDPGVLATVTVQKLRADTGIEVSAMVSCEGSGDGIGGLDVRVDVDGVYPPGAKCGVMGSATAAQVTASIPSVIVAAGAPVGSYTIRLIWIALSQQFLLDAANNVASGFTITAREVPLA